MVAFASPSDFYYYHLERGETWDYNEMRQEVGDLCAYGNLYFSIDDLVGAGAVLGSAESPDRFPPASNSYPFPCCWVGDGLGHCRRPPARSLDLTRRLLPTTSSITLMVVAIWAISEPPRSTRSRPVATCEHV